MTVVFDLDYTLMDTARFKEAMAASLADCGVAAGVFWDTYEQTSKTADKICDYDPERHVEALAESLLACGKAEALRRIDAVVSRAPEFIFPGAQSVLQRLRGGGATLVLLTHGNPSWQKRKAARSGLISFFENAIFAPEKKARAIDELRKLERPIMMVNDSGPEIDELQKLLPEARFMAVRGPKPLPSDPAVPVCRDLEEVYKAIRGM